MHATHTVHALPDLRIAAGRLRDGLSHKIFESNRRQWHSAGHQRSGVSESSGRGKRSKLFVLAASQLRKWGEKNVLGDMVRITSISSPAAPSTSEIILTLGMTRRSEAEPR